MKASAGGHLEQYLSEIGRIPLLSADGERQLARRFREQQDLRAGHRLITANLRFVVKVAYEYRSYGLRMADLIQEGNIGLMRAVRKFDPGKEIRLISYAVWWIRAYIQNYVLRSWSMVKLGTTQAQRKLFFSLAKTRRAIDQLDSGRSHGIAEMADTIAQRLGVKVEEVLEMVQRLDGRDLSLDVPVGEEGSASRVELVAGGGPAQDEALAAVQVQHVMAGQVERALARLDTRERFIIEQRIMAEAPMTLKDVGDHFGFSRERARQLELRARAKLRQDLCGLVEEIDWRAGSRAAGPEA